MVQLGKPTILGNAHIHPGKLTCWTPKNEGLEDIVPFQMDDFQVPAVSFPIFIPSPQKKL